MSLLGVMYSLLNLLSTCFIAGTYADLIADHRTTWIYPSEPPNPANTSSYPSGINISYGDTMNVQWTSTWDSTAQNPLLLKLWCGAVNLQPWSQRVNQNDSIAVKFTNLNLEDWPLPMRCNYGLAPTDSDHGSGSAAFHLNNKDVNLPATTWSLAAPTNPSSASSITATSPTSATPSSSTSGAAPLATGAALPSPNAKGLNTRDKAAIAAGSSVGGLAIIALLTFAMILHRRGRKRQQQQRLLKEKANSESASMQSHDYGKPEMAADRHPPQEMPLVKDTACALAPFEIASDERSERQELSGRTQTTSMHELPAADASKPGCRIELGG
ncbi:MAG: hypothetical protein Q9195_005963 [Heterodermia aff. obscurata]